MISAAYISPVVLNRLGEVKSFIDKNDNPTLSDWAYFFKVERLAILAAAGLLVYGISKTNLFKGKISKLKELKPVSEKSTEVTKYALGATAFASGLYMLYKANSIPSLQLDGYDAATKKLSISVNGIKYYHGVDWSGTRYYALEDQPDDSPYLIEAATVGDGSQRRTYVALTKDDVYIKTIEFYF